MTEAYVGPPQDRRYIARYLRNIRSLDPIEIATTPDAFPLSSDACQRLIDRGAFKKLTACAIERFRTLYNITVTPVDPSRYYVGQPAPNNLGGFHDPCSVGYQYWFQASFVVALNRDLVSTPVLTAELARNYLHDALHHSTYRTFRRAVRAPADSTSNAKRRTPEVYREQYGLNFRNRDGLSYSAPELTAQSPNAINLNLWMDGVVAITCAHAVRELLSLQARTLADADVINDLHNGETGKGPAQAEAFYRTVIAPTAKFVKRWGGSRLLALTLQAMVSGDLAPIRAFFADTTGHAGAWERMFRRADFKL